MLQYFAMLGALAWDRSQEEPEPELPLVVPLARLRLDARFALLGAGLSILGGVLSFHLDDVRLLIAPMAALPLWFVLRHRWIRASDHTATIPDGPAYERRCAAFAAGSFSFILALFAACYFPADTSVVDRLATAGASIYFCMLVIAVLWIRRKLSRVRFS